LVHLEAARSIDGDVELQAVIADPLAVDPDQAAITATLPGEVERLLARLSDRERAVLRLRFGLDRGEPRTLEDVGPHLNLTREAIRRIERRALAKLRHPCLGIRRAAWITV
jgi:RNA polymerase sigma factor (sigma-70 family)